MMDATATAVNAHSHSIIRTYTFINHSNIALIMSTFIFRQTIRARQRAIFISPRASACWFTSDANNNNTITDTSDSTSFRVETTIDSNGIARVCLNRPDKLNALDLRMFEAIAAEATKLKDNKSIRAVILSGKGRAFSTGLDVKAILKSNPKKTMDRLLERPLGCNGNLAQDVGYLWRDLPVPVICVLHGMCFGGGMQIALGADFRFATPDCKLSIMEAKWGLIPDMSASVTLRELVRADVAKVSKRE